MGMSFGLEIINVGLNYVDFFRDLYIDDERVTQLSKVINDNSTVNVFGNRGAGKTTLLRYYKHKFSDKEIYFYNENSQADISQAYAIIVDDIDVHQVNERDKEFKHIVQKFPNAKLIFTSGKELPKKFKLTRFKVEGPNYRDEIRNRLTHSNERIKKKAIDIVLESVLRGIPLGDIAYSTINNLLKQQVSLKKEQQKSEEIKNASRLRKINLPITAMVITIILFVVTQIRNTSTKNEIFNEINENQDLIGMIEAFEQDKLSNYFVNASKLNVRDKPGMMDNIIDTIEQNKLLVVKEKRNNWWFVEYVDNKNQAKEGWVYSVYLNPIIEK